MRRFTRYSIRSLLVLVTLACVALGWYVANSRVYHRQQAALTQLESLQGMIFKKIDEQEDSFYLNWTGHGTHRDWISKVELARLGPQWLRQLLSQFDRGITLRANSLCLQNTIVNDNAITYLVQLDSLKSLTIKQSRLTPDGEARLRRLLPDTAINLTPYQSPDGS